MRNRSVLAGLLGAVLCSTGALTVVAVPASAAVATFPTFNTDCFTSKSDNPAGTYTVPASGVTEVRAVLRGQNGAPGSNYGTGTNISGHAQDPRTAGGKGSTLVVELPVTPGEVLTVGSLTGAAGGVTAGDGVVSFPDFTGSYMAYRGGKGGDAQYLKTMGSDGCEHALAVAAGGGGGSGKQAAGGDADAGSGAKGGENGGSNLAVDGGGGGAATATGGGGGGAKGHSYFGLCHDGEFGGGGGFLTAGAGGNASATVPAITDCLFPAHSGGGGGAGYFGGGGGGSAYASGNESVGAEYSPGGGGGGSSYIDPSVTKVSFTPGATWALPIAAPVYNTATTITSTPNPSYAGGPVTITTRTTVVGTGQPVALGTVQIFGGGTLLTTVPVGSNGEATWTTSDLPAANVALSATFLSSEDPSVAYRASSTDGTLTQVVHACAPTPTFVNQPADAAATTGTTVVLSAIVSISPVFEGTPTMQWQTSSDNGATWTAAAGTTAIQTDGLAAGLGRATLSYTASGGPQRLTYRALATTCGGTATSNPAALTVRAIDFDLSTLPTKTFGSPAFDIASYASKSTVPVAFSSSTPATCAVAGTMVTVLAAGTCTITASEDGANGYPAAPQVQQSLASGKKPIAVLASNASQPQGTTSLPTITCTPSGYLGTDNYVTPPLGRVGRIATPADSYVPGFAPFFSPTIGMRAAGTYVSHCSGGDPGPNYVISKYIDGTFTITAPLPPPLKITANNASSTYGTTPPALGATYPSTTGVSGTLSCQAYATSDTSYTAAVALSATTPAGTYTVHCSGLTSTSSTISWVDGTLTVKPAPVTVTASSPSDQAQGATYAPTISCSADGFLGTDTFATNPTGAVYDSAGTAPVTIGSNTGVGTYVTKCQGGDPGANYTIAAYVPGTFTIKDVTPPVITVPGDKIVEATGPGGAATTFTATAVDAVDGTRPVTCTPASGSTFALGATTVTCTSTDTAGNTSTASFTITVVDTTPPVVTVPADRTVEATGPGGAAATFTATAADAVDGTPLVTCTPASGSTFPLGRTTVTCTSTDSAGNTSAAGFTITVVDTTPPVVTVPADKTVEATGPGGAAATFTATAADAVDGTPPATCSPASGSTFPLGRTTVTCTSTDTAGNTGTASFTITVVDTTPPVVTVPADKTVEATGPGGAATTFTATATDAVDGTPPATCTPASGSTFALGRTTVTCTSTDTAGNTGTASFTITVVDTTPPKTALGTNLPAPSSNLTNASFSFSGTDAVGPVSFECRLDQAGFAPCTSTKSYTGLSDGSHTFQVRAKDGAGNLDPTPASYTWVVDTTAPVLTVANVTVNATSPAGAAVPFMASATDTNPVSPVVTCTRASGSTFTTGTTTVTCSATDAAGNTGTASFTVTVKGASAQLTDLMTKVQNLPPSLDVTSRKNLLSILQSAQAAVGRGDIQGACDKLTSFASQVSAQTGKKISATAAAGLLADARRIMGVLGCP